MNIRNEWLILETYQQLQTEDKQAEEKKKAREVILRCKEDLDRQIAQNQERAKREREKDAAYDKEQALQHEKYKQEQEEARKVAHQKVL
ncbi:unnamed protein product, partial [Choristocarpus tenellus]